MPSPIDPIKRAEWKRRLSENSAHNTNRRGKKHSEESIRRMKENHVGNIGKKHSEESKRKIRISTINYIKTISDVLFPRIGGNEKQILDELERITGYKIIRQFEVCGYFLDGYIPELLLAIEVDEKPKNRQKDKERENMIINELKCRFLRIKDYD